MGLKSREKVIRGKRFVVGQLPATRAMLLGHRLLAALSPVLGGGLDAGVSAGLAGGGMEGAARSALARTDIGTVVPLLFDRLTGKELDHIVKELMATVVCQHPRPDGQVENVEVAQVFDEFFQGELAMLAQVVGFSLEVNFKDFWDALVAKLKGLAAAAKARAEAKKSAASATSSPPSGGSSP